MIDDLFAWMSIGAAASIAAMIVPFLRGASGVIAGIASRVGGALAAGRLGWLLLPGTLHERRVDSLLCAAVGAVTLIAIVHALYARWAGSRHPKVPVDAWRS